jgi:hypothetical protein
VSAEHEKLMTSALAVSSTERNSQFFIFYRLYFRARFLNYASAGSDGDAYPMIRGRIFLSL